MRIETILQRIEQEQAKFALDALRTPQGKEPFDYGRACGVYSGLEQAKTIILDLVRDVEDKDREL